MTVKKDKIVWAELKRKWVAMDLQVKCGMIQDATFIEILDDQKSRKRNLDD